MVRTAQVHVTPARRKAFTMARKAHNTLIAIVKGHLLLTGFTMDGSDPLADIFDEVYDFVLADHELAGTSRLIEDGYQDFNDYEDLAQFITETLA